MGGMWSLARWKTRSDAAVSAVIGVILMVAITVAIAATVYIYVGGFGTDEGGSESASATLKAVSADSDPKSEWLKVTLASGQGAPYDFSDVTIQTVAANGTATTKICDSPNTTVSGYCHMDHFFESEDTWEVGTSKFFPCSGKGDHSVTVAVRGTTILDRSVRCDEAP